MAYGAFVKEKFYINEDNFSDKVENQLIRSRDTSCTTDFERR